MKQPVAKSEKKPSKPMGRPPKHPEKGPRRNYTFRMNDADRDRVIEAAGLAGRSMSEEIERRIERSFEAENLPQILADEIAIRLEATLAKLARR